MPDIHCKFCGEPWDAYELHDVYNEKQDKCLPYNKAASLFAKYGCGLWDLNSPNGMQKCRASTVDETAAAYAEASQILSEHPDDWIYDSDMMFLTRGL